MMTPIFNAFLLDQECRSNLLLLYRTSDEGRAEAFKIITHLMRHRTSIRSPSSYVMSSIHEARNWLDRPPFAHPDFDGWLGRLRSGKREGFEPR